MGCTTDCLSTCRYFFKNKTVQYPLYTDNLMDLYNYRTGKHYTHFSKISHNKTAPSIWWSTRPGKKLCPVHELGQIHSYDLLIPIFIHMILFWVQIGIVVLNQYACWVTDQFLKFNYFPQFPNSELFFAICSQGYD
jgi:hypothetical protein